MTSHDQPAAHPPTDRDLLDRWFEREDAEAFHELVVRHGRMVLAVCRRILGDVHLADDLAQDCFLRLAEQRSGKARNVGAWLHAVAANAAKTARRDRRRREEEPIEEAQQEGVDPATPARVAAWRELEGEVDAAISALPEALREVVVGHFLEGRSHRELGRELGLGDRTVGYRIAKGIERLRRELAARGIRIDREALGVALVALPAPSSVPVAWGASLGRVALLGTHSLSVAGGIAALGLATAGSAKSVVMALAAVAALVLVCVWGFAERDAGSARTARNDKPVVRAAAIPEDAPTTAEDVPEPVQRAAIAAVPEAPPVDGDDVVVLGRCVDEAGNPLVGVVTDLHAWAGNDKDVALWELEHGPIAWEDPEDCPTDHGGRFEYRFAPPPPYRVGFRLIPTDRVHQSISWSSEDLEPGQVVDLGDVVLEEGIRLLGRLVDEEGAPVAQQTITTRRPLFSRSSSASRLSASTEAAAVTDARGRFEFTRRLPRGEGVVFQVASRAVVRPTDVLELHRPQTEVEIVVNRGSLPVLDAPDRSAQIQGTVVDQTGTPIATADVYRQRIPVFPDTWAPTTSGPTGRFVLRRSESAPLDLPLEQLHVRASGFEAWSSPEPIPWGTSDYTVRMVPGPSLELRVRRSDDGRPVERFLATLEPLEPDGTPVSSAHTLMEQADHPQGLLRIEHLTPARYRVSIHGRPSDLLAEDLEHEVNLVSGTPVSLDIDLDPLHSRRIVVTRDDGTPLVGARVELLRHRKNGLVRLDMVATSAENSRRHVAPGHDARIAIKADEATTAADGSATLTGPAGIPFAVRLPGPGHIPVLVQPVDLEEERSLEIAVTTGGSVSGSIAPLDVLEQIRAEGGPVGIRLCDPRGLHPDVPPRSSGLFGALVDNEGRFQIDGVQSGVWDVQLQWGRRQDSFLPWGTTAQVRRTLRAGIRIGPPLASELALDLEPLRRARVSARITIDGSPAQATVDLSGQVADPATSGLVASHFLITSGEGGLAEFVLPPGAWRTSVHVRHGNEFRSYDGPQFVLEKAVSPAAPWDIAVRSEPGSGR